MPRLTRIADGIYRDTLTGTLKHRPIINGRRTERSLVATTIPKAREELAALRMAQLNSRLHGGADPYAKPVFIGELAQQWLAKDCPDHKDTPRRGTSLDGETGRLNRLLPFWKDKPADNISIRDCKLFNHWRRRQSKRFSLARSVDAELVTLSNLLDWAVSEELIRVNAIGRNRPRFVDPEKVRHCPEVMPPTDEVFHQYAEHLLARNRSRPLGWQMLLEGLTGCRTSEILNCRTDAKELPNGKGEPGYCDGTRFHIKRAKKGINPFALLEAQPGHDPLRQCLNAFFAWHAATYAESEPAIHWFIPGRSGDQPQDRCSLTHALHRAWKELNKNRKEKDHPPVPEITSHGLRAYFVKTMRSLGVADAEIAARLGHRSTDQVENTYGEVESDWFGQKKMDFVPTTGKPAWFPWLPQRDRKIIPYQKAAAAKSANAAAPSSNHGREMVELTKSPKRGGNRKSERTAIGKA